MEVQRATYKKVLSSKGIIKYGLINNKLVFPYFPNKYNSDFVVLRKYNVVYHEMSGETRALPTKEYCLVLEKDIKKDDFFPKFYYTKKVLLTDFEIENLLGEKIQTFLKDRHREEYYNLLKYETSKENKEFSYSLLVELYKDNPDFSPTKLKLFIEKVLTECINHSNQVVMIELKSVLQEVPKKEDVLYYCFFPKICYYIHHFDEYDNNNKKNIRNLIRGVIDRMESTDTSKLLTNIDLEVLIKMCQEKSTP